METSSVCVDELDKLGLAAATFPDLAQAHGAVRMLREAGYSPDEVGCAFAADEEGGFWQKVVTLIAGEGDRTGMVLDTLNIEGAPRELLRCIDRQLKSGGALVLVHASGGDLNRARALLAGAGGELTLVPDGVDERAGNPTIKLVGGYSFRQALRPGKRRDDVMRARWLRSM